MSTRSRSAHRKIVDLDRGGVRNGLPFDLLEKREEGADAPDEGKAREGDGKPEIFPERQGSNALALCPEQVQRSHRAAEEATQAGKRQRQRGRADRGGWVGEEAKSGDGKEQAERNEPSADSTSRMVRRTDISGIPL